MKAVIFVIGILIVGLMGAETFGTLQSDLSLHADCKYCGMHRDRFAHSRMVLHFKDGTSVGVCSIFCAAKEYIRRVNEAPAQVEVGDYGSKELTNALEASWVIGGSKTGVMTNRAKWAFRTRCDALKFVSRYGGRIADFDAAMRASYEDIYEDMRALKQMQLEYARSRHAARKTSNLSSN
ncbi:MAG: nitrous oxide reductase accessory protein NosL [Syntrophobacteraceae bacterium]